MTAPAEPPRYVYKIVDIEPQFPIPDVFPPSELDRKDGFIHLSAPWQVSQPTGSTITNTSTFTHFSRQCLSVARLIPQHPSLNNPARVWDHIPPPPPTTTLRSLTTGETGTQLPITADLFFSRHTTLWVLKIRLASIEGSVRWEPPAGGGGSNEGYPHLYGSLGRPDVESVERFKRTADERGVFQNRWKDVFSDSRWRAWEEGKGMAVEE